VLLVVNGKREFLGLVFRDAFVREQNTVPRVRAAHGPAPHLQNFGWAH
jgi:hypothetical protein